ncbi:ABC transporter substrate-binding protein [Bacillus sp. 03113]|uniref:ABC transporter substrate-binding protein n=1 Tax=Bacillus sp. 03113 TaxID=2578211 RepID=UPI001144EC3C|nr:ABC transporter substrate-binding protein [Bacillus sp. 03113]
MRHIKVMLEYFHPWTNSAGFYYAREQGWYREIRLEIDFVCYDPYRGDTLSYLYRNEVDFGIFPTNRLFVYREKSPIVKGIAAINHTGMEAIQTIKSTEIKRPADLSGKRIAMNPSPRGLAMVKYLIEQDGGKPEFEVVNAGYRELEAIDLANGVADATFGSYWAWELQLHSTIPHDERIIWPVDSIGAPKYHSYLLGTQEKLINQDPELIRQFLEVTERGFLAVAKEPLIAASIYEKIIPYFPSYLVECSLPLIAPTWLNNGQWGEQREEIMKEYSDWLVRYQILDDPDGWKTAYTNHLLPKRSIV